MVSFTAHVTHETIYNIRVVNIFITGFYESIYNLTMKLHCGLGPHFKFHISYYGNEDEITLTLLTSQDKKLTQE